MTITRAGARNKITKPLSEGGAASTSVSVSPRTKIANLLKKVEEKLEEDTSKASLGDFIRLVQLERELADEETPREIRVRWVESPMTSESVT